MVGIFTIISTEIDGIFSRAVLMSAHQNRLYLQHKFWQALASTHSAEHASGVTMFQLKSYMCIIFTLCSDSIIATLLHVPSDGGGVSGIPV